VTSIATERRLYQRVGFTHRLRGRWGARFDYTTARTVDEPATRLFLHISVTNPNAYSSNDAHARAIEAIGIGRFPNTGISYNELVMPGGHLYEAQPMGRRGAHTVNDYRRSACTLSGCPSNGYPLTAPSWNLNFNSRACCLARNIIDPVSDADVDAAARWGAAGKLTGMVDRAARWHGHRCVAAKECPGDKAWARLDDIADLTADYVRQGDVDVAISREDRDAIAKRVLTIDEVIRNLGVDPKVNPESAYWTLGGAISNIEDTQDKDHAALVKLAADVARLKTAVAGLGAKIDQLSLGGLTQEALAAIAQAVNDELARRQQA
jgi:hypothetical protein